MIRIRFHGRGGHGIKTASRILGTAAFRAGFQVQDSPIYGAERRGAAIAAFTRIDARPILERGLITEPDLIILADETLLEDTTARVLAGQQFATAIFANSESVPTPLHKSELTATLFTLNLTDLSRSALGSGAALSVALAAVAARLIGVISEAEVARAVEEELDRVAVRGELLRKNLQLAETVFGRLQPLPETETPSFQTDLCFARAAATGRVGGIVHPLQYDPPYRSTPSILAAGNAVQRRTGNWRIERPEIHHDLCTKCGICLVRCPDGAIGLSDDGYPKIDYEHCKGCMICLDQCPVANAISREREVRAW